MSRTRGYRTPACQSSRCSGGCLARPPGQRPTLCSTALSHADRPRPTSLDGLPSDPPDPLDRPDPPDPTDLTLATIVSPRSRWFFTIEAMLFFRPPTAIR